MQGRGIVGQDKAKGAKVSLDLQSVADVVVNAPAVRRRAAAIEAAPLPKGIYRAAWLVNAIRCMDLTTLAGDDTEARVARLCAKARQPLAPEIATALGVEGLTTAAVCVYPTMVAAAVRALEGSGIGVASVATGFPAGLTPLATRLAEVRYAVDQGAGEVDIVITRSHVLRGEWGALYDEVAAMKEACGPAHLKAILATGDLGPYLNIARASLVAMQAGADFIKTSTGKEAVNATLPVSLVMCRAIRRFGGPVGFKPAGGLRTAHDALIWQVLMAEELGRAWLSPDRFRIGASSLLGDIERALYEYATGRVAAPQALAMG